MGKGKFDPLQSWHLLIDRQSICQRWLHQRPLHLCQIWCKSFDGGFSANGWNITKIIYLYYFGNILQVRPLNGFLRVMAQAMWNHTRVCLLRSSWYWSPFRDQIFQNPLCWGHE